jgi:hypothetical protein
MRTRKQACFPNGIENSVCPNCGRPMQVVDYYTARPLRQEEIRRTYESHTIRITYTDVNPHSGNICLFCARDNSKGSRTTGLMLMAGGGALAMIAMIWGVAAANLTEKAGGDVGAALGLPMALMCIFIIAAIVGLAIFIETNRLNPWRKNSQEQLFVLFQTLIKKEGSLPGAVCLSPGQVNQMQRG